MSFAVLPLNLRCHLVFSLWGGGDPPDPHMLYVCFLSRSYCACLCLTAAYTVYSVIFIMFYIYSIYFICGHGGGMCGLLFVFFVGVAPSTVWILPLHYAVSPLQVPALLSLLLFSIVWVLHMQHSVLHVCS